jgi:hypothetical protein
MKSMNLPYGSSVGHLSGIHTGILPSRVVVAFLETPSFDGVFEKNPFNFQNFGINFLRLKCGARVAPYTNGIRLDYAKNAYLQGYNTLFQGLNGAPCDISYEEYKSGHAIYVFDLSPDTCHGNHFNLLREGSLDLEILLDKALINTAVTAVFYLEFDNVVELDKQKQISLDYKV